MKDFFTMSGSERNKILNELNEKYPTGTRVKLVRMNDFQAPPIGTEGTVENIDDIGTIHIKWDSGSSLGIAYGEDEIMKIN
jgi:hypothetical protein